MSCDVSGRHDSDPTLLWLGHRPAAVALIRPLAWELPYATNLALKRKKEKKKQENMYSVLTVADPFSAFFSFGSYQVDINYIHGMGEKIKAQRG